MPDLDTGFGKVVLGQQLTPARPVLSITGVGAGPSSGRGSVADVGRQGDAGGPEEGADDAGGGRAQGHLPPVLGDLDLLQPIEIDQHIAPLRPEAGLAAARVQLLAQHQGEEGAEDVAADGGVGGVVDRPGAHQRLGGAEQVLHLQQVAVAEHGLQRGDAGVELPISALSPRLSCRSRASITARRSPPGGHRPAVTARRSAASFAASASLRQTMWRLPSAVTSLTQSWVSSPPARGMQSGVKARPSSSTTRRTSASVRSRAPSTYSRPRSSRAATAGAEIMPRSATPQTRPMAKRPRRRSTTGRRTPTSAVLPGHICEQTGWPSASITTPRIISIRSGRWSFE